MMSSSRGRSGAAPRLAGELLFDSAPARRLLRRQRTRLLDDALANGLAPALADPLRWLATAELSEEDRRRLAPIEEARSALARSDALVPTPGGRQVPLRRVALHASIDRRFGTFLHLCAKAIGAGTVLELGSALGIGTSYMAAAGPARVVSIEASPERAAIARDTAAGVADGVEVVTGRFDDVLPGVLEELPQGVDMAWVDGHHRRDPTMRYFEAIRPKLNDGALVAFDDIRTSREMREAWRRLSGAEAFSETIDLGAIGIGIRGSDGSPRTHDLRGIWGRPRSLHAFGDRLRS